MKTNLLKRKEGRPLSSIFLRLFALLAVLLVGVNGAWAQIPFNNDQSSWVGSTGMYNGTYVEKYVPQQDQSNPEGGVGAGDILVQEFTGLENGLYKVVLKLAASFTSNRGFNCPTGPFLSYGFAGNDEVSIDVKDRTEVPDADMETVALFPSVTDGTLKLGIRNKAASGNWYLAHIVSIEKLASDATRYFELKINPKEGGQAVLTLDGTGYYVGRTDVNGYLKKVLPQNTWATFTATANSDLGFHFVNWTNSDNGSQLTTNVSRSLQNKSNLKYTANFSDADDDFKFTNTNQTIELTIMENAVTNKIIEGFVYTGSSDIKSDLCNNCTWESSNPAVAVFDASDGNKKLRLVDVGVTDIKVTNPEGKVARLHLTVTAGQATHIITDMGNMTTKCEVSGVGKLNDERTVLRVPNILFRHGIWGFEDNPADPTDNTTTYYKQVHSSSIVREYELTSAAGSITKVLGASTIAQNGYANTGMANGNNDNNNRPTAGTFYTFDPEVSGTLVVHGYIVNGSWGVFPKMYQWIDQSDGTIVADGALSEISAVADETFREKGVVDDANINLTEITMTYKLAKGKTYYLNGGFKDGNARIYLLDYFTYTPERPNFATKSVRWDKVNVDGKYTQTATVGGGASVKYNAYVIDNSQVNPSVDRTVRSANSDLGVNINSSTGQVTISGNDGGAILVTATVGEGQAAESDYYIITVPYNYKLNNNAGHIWNFANTVDWKKHMVDDDMSRNDWETALKSLKKRSDWKTEHKVREYKGVNGALSYINVPVVASTAVVDGNNAFYIPNTAGLTFNTADMTARFGSLVKGWRQDTNDKDFSYYNKYGDDLKAKLEIPFTEVEFTDWVAICDGASFTIPNVPQDWFVKIYWSEHSAHNGSCFQATNVKDLEGRDINPEHCFVITGHDAVNSNGMPDGVVVFKAKETGDVTFTLNDPDKGYSWNDIIRIEVCKNYSTDLTLRLDQTGANWVGDKVACDNEISGHVVVRRYFKEAGADITMTEYDHIKGFYYKGLVDYDEFIKATPSNANQPTSFTEGVTKIYSGVVGPCRCERGLSPLFTIEDVDGANVIGGKIDYYYDTTGKVVGKYNNGSPTSGKSINELKDNGIVVNGLNVKTELKSWASDRGAWYYMFYVTYKGGYGNVKITQKLSRPIRQDDGTDDWSTQYTLDYKETYVAVGELNVMPYPYTWDFRDAHYSADTENTTKNRLWNSRKLTEDMDAISDDAVAYNNVKQYGVYGAWDYVWRAGNQMKLYAPTAERWYEENSGLKNAADDNPYLFLQYPEPKSRFALNSQVAHATKGSQDLKDGGTVQKIMPIHETQGLGIGVSKISGATPDVVNIGDETGNLRLKSNNGGNMKVTIPSVPAGMYVFVKANVEPSVTGAVAVGDEVANESYTFNGKATTYKFNKSEVANGVYVYKVETSSDVVLSSPDIQIEAIGVTNEFKMTTNDKNWVTDSRRRRIDYRNTALFTKFNTKSYITNAHHKSGIVEYEGTLTTVQKDVIPPLVTGYSEYTGNKGLLLHNEGTATTRADGLIPLFVPACNYPDDLNVASPDVNFFVHHIDEGDAPGTASDYSTIRYGFTNQYYTWNSTDKNSATAGSNGDYHVADNYNFYISRQSGNARKNIAYLELTKAQATAASKIRTFYIMYSGQEDEEVVGIEDMLVDQDILSTDDSKLNIYTISGSKLEKLPSAKGVYIINGKKVFVK